MRAFTRLGVACSAAILLLFTTATFRSSASKQRMKKIEYLRTGHLEKWWSWASPNSESVRIVVFGDNSVVGSELDEQGGRGKSWPQILCEKIDCRHYTNFASSQLPKSNPATPPTGALTSNRIYVSKAASLLNSAPAYQTSALLPDLAAQIQQFIALSPPTIAFEKTYFIVSFGLWDIYHTTGLDFDVAVETIEDSITEIFRQADILYSHYSQNLAARRSAPEAIEARLSPRVDQNIQSKDDNEHFILIIPKPLDPTLHPGWLTQRPRPSPPSSIAEQEKNAIHLTRRWNAKMEQEMGIWLQQNKSDNATPYGLETRESETPRLRKDMFYPYVSSMIKNIVLENQLFRAGFIDPSGLGMLRPDFEYVNTGCVESINEDRAANWWFDTDKGEQKAKEVDGMTFCNRPGSFLWWDGWGLGSKGMEKVAELVAGMIDGDRSVNMIWKEGRELKEKEDDEVVEKEREGDKVKPSKEGDQAKTSEQAKTSKQSAQATTSKESDKAATSKESDKAKPSEPSAQDKTYK